jgi:hypothetical protein
LTLHDASGRTITEIDKETLPTIFAKITGLPANKPFELMLYRDGQPLYHDAQGNLQPITATSDEKGEIPAVVLFYDLGVDPQTGFPTPASGSYSVRIWGSGVDKLISFTVRSRSRRQQIPERTPTVWVVRKNGAIAGGSIPEGEPVYAAGINFPPNRKVRLYVVRDKRGWNAGAIPTDLEDVTGVIEEVTTNSSGEIGRTLVWASAQPVNGQRDFDLVANVADENGNFDTKYTPGVDAVDADLTTGFTVQGPPQPIVRVDLASDPQGNYRDSFSANETVTIWVNPPNRPLIPICMMVKKYICPHKETWNYGDQLVDVTGRAEWDLVRCACLNQYLYTVWAPPLTSGTYDPVIDVNQNGVYDQGDILGKPFEVRGIKPKRIFVSARFPFVDPNGETSVTAALIDENDRPMPNQTVQFSVTDSSASVSPTSAQTNQQGIALTTLRVGSIGGITLRVKATATVEGVTVTGETEVQVRAYGGINAIVRSKW